MKKGRPPRPRLSEFRNFLLGFFKRWIFLFFWELSILSFLIPIVIPEISLPVVFGVSILFVGFIWTAFLENRDLLQAYQKSVVTVPVEKNKRSGITISFVPGNEYLYTIADPYSGQNLHMSRMQEKGSAKCHFDERGVFFVDGQVYYLMSRSGLEINFQLFNSGDVPLEIFSIYVDDSLELNHLRHYLDGIYLHGIKVKFPLHLKKGEFITLQSRHKISLGMVSTDALFAAEFRSLPKSILYDVIVTTANVYGKRQSFVAQLTTSSDALVELYVKQWQEYDQQEYLILAGHGPMGDE